MTIENAPIGVYNERYNTRVTRLNMENTTTGIWSQRNGLCDVQVRNCNITNTRIGILWQNNDRALRMIAAENTIITNNPYGICIYASEFMSGNNANYQIIDNYHLETNNANSGIFLSGVENARVGYNTVYTNGNPANGTIGINLAAGRSNNLYCNTVMSTIPKNNINSSGLKMGVSTDNVINCNHFNSGYRGIYFKGFCTGTDLKGNSMTNNAEGLYLDGSAVIGIQSHKGNVWTGSFGSGFGANNVNSSFPGLQASEFRVNTSMGTVIHPNVPLYDIAFPAGTAPTNWFNVNPLASPFNCVSSNSCIAALHDDEDAAVERAIATDSLQTFEFDPESRVMARAYLLDKLNQDDTLLYSDSVYTAFYNIESSTTNGQLYSVKEKYNEVRSNPYLSALLLSLDSLLKIKGDSISLLDSLAMETNYNVNPILREDLLISIIFLRSTLNNIQIQKNIYEIGKRDSVAILNDAIQSSEIPDVNQQSGTHLVLLYQEFGLDTLEYFLNDILAIANQCPNSGGPWVYKMRALAKELVDSIQFDDVLTCLQQGYYRLGNGAAISKLLQEIELVPNPAGNTVEVILKNTGFARCNLAILDQLGKTVLNQSLNCENNRHRIDISGLTQGIYLVNIAIQNQNFTKKLVIIR